MSVSQCNETDNNSGNLKAFETPMAVREFKKSDRSQLRSIYLETRRQEFYWLNNDTLALDNFDKDTEGERVWVYELPAEIAGFASIWEPDDFVHHLFILPKYAGRGFGSQLLAACTAEMKNPARLKCVSQNTKALSFYRSRGWQTLSKGTSAEGEYQLMQAPRT